MMRGTRAPFLCMLVAAVLAAGCDWRQTATAPFRKTRDVISSTGRGIGRMGQRITGGEERGGNVLDQYAFVVEIAGRRRTEGRTVLRHTTFRGLDAVETVTEQETTVRRDDREYTRQVDRRELVGPHGEALRLYEVTTEGGVESELMVSVEGQVARFETRDGAESQPQTMELNVPAGIIFDLDAFWLSQQDLRPGATFEAETLSVKRRRVVRQSATVLRLTQVSFQDDSAPAWVIRIESEATPEVPVTLTMTRDGRLIRMDAGAAAFRVVSRTTEPAGPVEMDEVVTAVPMDRPLPAWDAYDGMVLRAEPADVWAEHISESEYCQGQRTEGGLLLNLSRFMPQVPSSVPFPPENIPADLQTYLESEATITPENETIRRIAQRVTAKESDALQAVAYLAGWVHVKVKWNAKGRMNTAPVETVSRQRGDCSEHADLFASLARAVGIPTRHCLGLLVRDGEGRYHNWVEAYVGGKWVPVDTTVNRVGLPAGYILTARESADTGELVDKLPWAMRQHKLGLSVEELQKAGYTIYPDKPRTHVAVRENWLANLYWGFSLVKPPAWVGRMTLDGIEITSPDGKAEDEGFVFGTASVKANASKAEYKATEGEIASLTEALDRNMTAFRRKEATILNTRHGRMLFVDYTCRVEDRTMRCRQYIIPRMGRSYRVSCWAPKESFEGYIPTFREVLDSMQF